MKKIILSGCILFLAVAGMAIAKSQGPFLTSLGPEPITATYQQINALFTGEWQQYGQLFTSLQHDLFPRLFLLVITIVPVFLFLHYIAIGPISLPHDGKQVYCYNLFVRVIHWCTALSFSLLVITGLFVFFGSFIGSGTLGIVGRNIHFVSAITCVASAFFMFFFWMKDMLPAFYDLKWMMIMGGYLSKEVKPVPAGKFNAGQKMWFWLATLGGAVMAVTGYFLYILQGNIDILRLSSIVHNALGAVMVAMFLIHLYMSIVAIKGSLGSMINGYKSETELKILHSKFKF